MTVPVKGYQTPSRGSGPSRSQEAGPGTLAPSSLPAAPTAAAATAPAPTRRARHHGPGALLREERQRLARIEPNLLFSDPAPLAARRQDAAMRKAAPSPLLAPSERVGAPALPLAPRKRQDAPSLPRPRPIVILPPRKTSAAAAPTIPAPYGASAPDPPSTCSPSSCSSDG